MRDRLYYGLVAANMLAMIVLFSRMGHKLDVDSIKLRLTKSNTTKEQNVTDTLASQPFKFQNSTLSTTTQQADANDTFKTVPMSSPPSNVSSRLNETLPSTPTPAATPPVYSKVDATSSNHNDTNITQSVLPLLSSPTTIVSRIMPSCCLYPVSMEDLLQKYSNNKDVYNKLTDIAPLVNGSSCRQNWNRLVVLDSLPTKLYDAMLVSKNASTAVDHFYPFVSPQQTASAKKKRRVLFLGDSISWGTLSWLMRNMDKTDSTIHDTIHVQGAPTNCGNFARYRRLLDHWLGTCPWDVVQFNVGMHFHPPPNQTAGEWKHIYQRETEKLIDRIHSHSPQAKIIVALTTPSPLDSQATSSHLNATNCPSLGLFHHKGFVADMNQVIREHWMKNNSIIINDRYSLLLNNHLEHHQKRCDIHFFDSGYSLLASHDWNVVLDALDS